jgi:hypothetical protein
VVRFVRYHSVICSIAHRVIDERTGIPSHFTNQELEEMYRFEPNEEVDQSPIEIEDDNEPHDTSQPSASDQQRPIKVVFNRTK